jgi:uncharacterized damage-inducible protein DinB
MRKRRRVASSTEVYDICMDRISPEPWLRGSIAGWPAIVTQLLYSLQQTREDLEYFTDGLSHDQLWSRPHGLASVGFHIRHMAGSIDRLLTYARGEQLTPEQMAYLKAEIEPVENVVAWFRTQLDRFEKEVRASDISSLEEPRRVGRKGLPTTVGALLVHVAEHTQRHLGQAIVTAKLARSETVQSHS